jgi:hypothetical protein
MSTAETTIAAAAYPMQALFLTFYTILPDVRRSSTVREEVHH